MLGKCIWLNDTHKSAAALFRKKLNSKVWLPIEMHQAPTREKLAKRWTKAYLISSSKIPTFECDDKMLDGVFGQQADLSFKAQDLMGLNQFGTSWFAVFARNSGFFRCKEFRLKMQNSKKSFEKLSLNERRASLKKSHQNSTLSKSKTGVLWSLFPRFMPRFTKTRTSQRGEKPGPFILQSHCTFDWKSQQPKRNEMLTFLERFW